MTVKKSLWNFPTFVETNMTTKQGTAFGNKLFHSKRQLLELIWTTDKT